MFARLKNSLKTKIHTYVVDFAGFRKKTPPDLTDTFLPLLFVKLVTGHQKT